MLAIPLASWLDRPPHRPKEVSCQPSMTFATRGPNPLHCSSPVSNGFGYDLRSWLLILSFHFCLPSALGSWQMISLLFTPVCPHTLSPCVFSFQTIFNVYPSQPFRASPNPTSRFNPTCCKPCKETPGHFRLLESMTSGDQCRPDQTSFQISEQELSISTRIPRRT